MQYTSVLDQMSGSATTWPMAGLPIDLPTAADATLPCQESQDGDLWFAERGEDVERAKTMCRQCPIKRECLDGAIARREPWGVWGGEVFIDGVIVARKRGRGRPRKDQSRSANSTSAA